MTGKMTSSAAALVLCGALCVSLQAGGGGAAQAQLDAFSDQLVTLRAAFEQRVMREDGSLEDGSSGRVWLQRPDRFRWEYGGDFPEQVVADGARVWIYDEALEQVTVRPQGDIGVDSPLVLLTDPDRLEQQFLLREMGDFDGMDLLELKPRAVEADFDRILLGLRDDQLQLMVMEDAFGLRTEIRFAQVERNPDLDPALFRFEPPAEADVIGELPAR